MSSQRQEMNDHAAIAEVVLVINFLTCYFRGKIIMVEYGICNKDSSQRE